MFDYFSSHVKFGSEAQIKFDLNKPFCCFDILTKPKTCITHS